MNMLWQMCADFSACEYEVYNMHESEIFRIQHFSNIIKCQQE